MLARFNADPPTANESLVVYCSRQLNNTPQEQLAHPVAKLQQIGMVQMFDFSFTDVKIVLLSLGVHSR